MLQKRYLRALGICFALCTPLVMGGDLPTFDDNFEDDPLSNGWTFAPDSASVWVEPGTPGYDGLPLGADGASCGADPNFFDPLLPCSLYPEDLVEGAMADGGLEESLDDFGGYILVTSGQGDLAGNAYRTELTEYDNFQMTVVVELRDGTIGRPADGMCIVLADDLDAFTGDSLGVPGLGFGGGGMGAPGIGDRKQLIFEFDNWNCNVGDVGDNSVGFGWCPTGCPATDSIPMSAGPIDFATPRLHNQEPHPATPNRFEMIVELRGGRIAASLRAIDEGTNLGRVYDFSIPLDEWDGGFEGYLGVTASTGGANQNHILHSAKVVSIEGVCTEPPLSTIVRTIEKNTPDEETNGGEYVPGESIEVTLALGAVRTVNKDCEDAPAGVEITEIPPEGWDVEGISDGGEVQGDGSIVWSLRGISEGDEVSYSVVGGRPSQRKFGWSGSAKEIDANGDEVVGPQLAGVSGDSSITSDYPFGPCGGILSWNLLGPFIQHVDVVGEAIDDGLGHLIPANGQPGEAPGEDIMRLDYLTDDDDITELDFEWAPGAQVETDFGGEAASQGLLFVDADFDTFDDINPDEIPTVIGWNDPSDSLINLNDDVYGTDPDGVMSYAQVYIQVEEKVTLHWGFSSDDSIQVLLDGEEIWINNIPRGGADACAAQDRSNLIGAKEVVLEPGVCHSLMIKTFEGAGGFNFSAGFFTLVGLGTASPFTDYTVSKTNLCKKVEPEDRFIRGDADGSGAINITDGISVLNFLFLGGADPGCKDAADPDDSNAINITDGIYILNFLFLGGPNPDSPWPDCGVDTTPSDLGCLMPHRACL